MIMELQNFRIQGSRNEDLCIGANNRSGIHSVKPVMIQEIFDLLVDRDGLFNSIRRLQDKLEAEAPW
jgi:hypothetical protein